MYCVLIVRTDVSWSQTPLFWPHPLLHGSCFFFHRSNVRALGSLRLVTESFQRSEMKTKAAD